MDEKEGIGNWVLDLRTTALFNLLAELGENLNGMEVYCGQSQPIATFGSNLDAMLNNEERIYIDMDGQKHPITFNLTQPIKMVDSTHYPGIQIADVFASTVGYTLRHENEKFSQECLKILFSHDVICDRFSVFPDLGYTDTTEYYGFVNSNILDLLIKKTLNGEDPLSNIETEISELDLGYKKQFISK